MWEDLFAWDGSLIDIYVLNTTLEDWQRLLDFMHALGSTLGKAVILTPENFQQRPLYRFDPQTGTQEWLS